MEKFLAKTFVNYIRTFLFLIITVVLEIGLLAQFNFELNNIYFYENGYLYFILFIGLYYLIKKTFLFKEKRLNVNASIFAFIISIIYILSYMTSNYFLQGLSPISLKFFCFISAKLFATFVLFFIVIKLLYKKIDCTKKYDNSQKKYFTNNKKSFFLVALLIFIAYIPYLIHSFPGNLNYDFIVQIKQALNYETLTNWHPYAHTLFIGLCLKTGYFFTNNYNIGIFIYTLLQVLLSCFTFSFVIYYMAKNGVKTKFRVLTLLLFMFFPMFPLYSVWLTKDIIFSLFMVFITIGIIEICTNKEIIKSKKYIIYMIIVFLLTMLSRKNGIYILAILFPFVLLFNRKNWLRILIMFSIPILAFKIIDGPVRTNLNIPNGSKAEMYSISAQQMARIYKYESETLTPEQKEKIESYILADNIEELYNPLIADPIKGILNIEKIDSNKLDLFKLNLDLFLEYPARSIESFLCTTYRFYYLNNDGAKGLENFKTDSASLIENMFPKELSITNNFYRIKIIDFINDKIYANNTPILSTMTNPGLYINIFIIFIGYLIYKKDYKYILCFIPVFLVLLTQLAGPMVDIRYAYSFFTCAPVLTALVVYNKKENNKNKE